MLYKEILRNYLITYKFYEKEYIVCVSPPVTQMESHISSIPTDAKIVKF